MQHLSECSGKICYPPHQKRQAEKTATRLSHGMHRRFTVYRCATCDNWHVGAQLKPQRKLPRLH